MKNVKRVLCLLLAVLMVMCCFGCDKPDPGTEPDGTSGNGKYDFGGKTLKIAVWHEGEKPELGDSDSEDAWYYSLKNARNRTILRNSIQSRISFKRRLRIRRCILGR